jgi:hypothetical protein
MSYTVKRGKLGKRKWKEGEKVFLSYAHGQSGWWWVQANIRELRLQHDISQYPHGGPFHTLAEAERDSQVATFGPQCKFKDGGQWDPAWDRPQ